MKISCLNGDLLPLCVCNVNSKECMLKQCEQCAGTESLNATIVGKLSYLYDSDETMFLNNGKSTDRCTLNEYEMEFGDFVDNFGV